MSVMLKRNASGLCRCPDGSLAICADCDCTYAGDIDIIIDGVGPLLIPYVDATYGFRGQNPTLGATPLFPSIPQESGAVFWATFIQCQVMGDCLWRWVVHVEAYDNAWNVLVMGDFVSGNGEIFGCWLSSGVLALMCGDGCPAGWPTALDFAAVGHVIAP
jgi:hypothetical protein